MVQRKDSLSYVEFIRGKYTTDQKHYLMKLVSNMTPSEREALATLPFDQLWKKLWQSEDCKGFLREYNEAKSKFEMLKRGYIMRTENNEIYYFDIDYILGNTPCNLTEAEWGFPKGRRNINEHDFTCAVREFKEETGIHPRNIRVINNLKPFEEVFSGTNKVRYKHIYYIALINSMAGVDPTGTGRPQQLYDPGNKVQSREIKDVKWFNYEDVQSRISDYNIERKELFKRVDTMLTKVFSEGRC
jgi:ADP-ribose pyrophosphatase YjhB (NUDIX family)